MFSISETRDKATLADFFRTDRSLYAYLLGDLDPFFFGKSRWWIARRNSKTSGVNDTPVEAALLRYGAFSTPVLIGLAENDAQLALWENALGALPSVAHVHYRKSHERLFTDIAKFERIGAHYKMVWHPKQVRAGFDNIDLSEVESLSLENIASIRALHACASPGAYFDERLLKTGLCFGIWRGETLAAFSGCHVYSEQYSVAALGAIATDPVYRGQGLGAKVTLRLLNKLRNHLDCICLNVHSQNLAALRIYERLGFRIHCEYEEALLDMR